ncbi:MAG: hypothetical protein JKX78_12825 [Alteromonadaceae bacterium]|nr:hypothetical protein [Alteromonadaceae bacterium]
MKKVALKSLVKSCFVGAIALSVMSSANAATGTFAVGFTTVADITITEVQPISFGTTMFITNAGTCTMNVATPLAVTMQAELASLSGSNFGNVAGSGCVTTAAGAGGNQGGYFRLTGISGADVKVTINSASNADFGFVPSGCAIDHDGTAGANTDSCLAFTAGTPLTVTLANSTDAGGTNPVDKQLMLAVGGTITVNQALTSATVYTQNFTIVAIY